MVDLTNSTEGFKDDSNTNDLIDDYDYDEYGNMIKDENKDITNITYNHLNLPIEIEFDEGENISYTYDASGIKLKKTVFDGTHTTITEYIDGYQYEDKPVQIGGRGYNHLLFFPTTEGYVKPVYSEILSEKDPKFQYVYNYTDHLGNIRLSYTKGIDGTLKVLEENNYYPFGLKHSAYNQTQKKLTRLASNDEKAVVNTGDNGYQYKYNGKELQDELGLNLYDYGARLYDPALGRWFVMDALADTAPSLTPYRYAFNNPLAFVDPDGNMESEIWDIGGGPSPFDGEGVDEVIITGNASEKATEELNKSTSLQITRDSETGKLSASGEAKTDADKKLLEAINSKTIKVELNATTDKLLNNNQVLADGAYLGNQLSEDKKSVVASQAVNPVATGKMSDFNEKPGADTLHEVIEAYVGGEIAIKEGVSGTPETNYLKVHNEVSKIAPQSSPAYITKQNGVTLYWVGDGKSPTTTCIYNSYDPSKK